MKKALLGLLIVSSFESPLTWAQTTIAPAAGKSNQILVCNEKVTELAKQLSPLEAAFSTPDRTQDDRNERRRIGEI